MILRYASLLLALALPVVAAQENVDVVVLDKYFDEIDVVPAAGTNEGDYLPEATEPPNLYLECPACKRFIREVKDLTDNPNQYLNKCNNKATKQFKDDCKKWFDVDPEKADYNPEELCHKTDHCAKPAKEEDCSIGDYCSDCRQIIINSKKKDDPKNACKATVEETETDFRKADCADWFDGDVSNSTNPHELCLATNFCECGMKSKSKSQMTHRRQLRRAEQVYN